MEAAREIGEILCGWHHIQPIRATPDAAEEGSNEVSAIAEIEARLHRGAGGNTTRYGAVIEGIPNSTEDP